MPKRAGEHADRRLGCLVELADECRAVDGGCRLRFARNGAMLRLVIGAIDANPALRFHMTFDESGSCWVDVLAPRDTTVRSTRPCTDGARPAVAPVVA